MKRASSCPNLVLVEKYSTGGEGCDTSEGSEDSEDLASTRYDSPSPLPIFVARSRESLSPAVVPPVVHASLNTDDDVTARHGWPKQRPDPPAKRSLTACFAHRHLPPPPDAKPASPILRRVISLPLTWAEMRAPPTNDFEEVLAATISLSPSSSRRSSLSSSPLGPVRGARPSSSSDLLAPQSSPPRTFRRNVSFGEGVELEVTRPPLPQPRRPSSLSLGLPAPCHTAVADAPPPFLECAEHLPRSGYSLLLAELEPRLWRPFLVVRQHGRQIPHRHRRCAISPSVEPLS